jgi:hypothetical protein
MDHPRGNVAAQSIGPEREAFKRERRHERPPDHTPGRLRIKRWRQQREGDDGDEDEET